MFSMRTLSLSTLPPGRPRGPPPREAIAYVPRTLHAPRAPRGPVLIVLLSVYAACFGLTAALAPSSCPPPSPSPHIAMMMASSEDDW